jgi:hypothetical protein
MRIGAFLDVIKLLTSFNAIKKKEFIFSKGKLKAAVFFNMSSFGVKDAM